MTRFVSVLVMLGAFACGDSTTREDVDGGADDGSVADGNSTDAAIISELDEIPAAYASAYCARIESCFGQAADVFFRGIDCQAVYESFLRNALLPSLETSVGNASLTFHGDRLTACTQALRSVACRDFNGPALPECDALFEGNVPMGGACTTDAECRGDAFCLSGGTCPATCAAVKGQGAGCVRDEECQSHYCSAATSACATRAGLGAACDVDASECEFGLVCLGANADMSRPGVCHDPATLFTGSEGDSCDLDNGPWCSEGLSCTVVQVAPVARLECRGPSMSGASCGFGVPDSCPIGEYCSANIAMGMTTGVCRTMPGDGDACAQGVVGPVCGSGTACASDGHCHTMRDNGAACSFESECFSGDCSEGACSAPSICE